MPKLPVVSGRQTIKALTRDGWVVERQESSHITLKKPGHRFLLTVPQARELDRGLLRGLIRDAGMTVARFVELLEQ